MGLKLPRNLPRAARRLGIVLTAVLIAGCSPRPATGPVQRAQPSDPPRRQVQVEIAGSPGLKFEGALGEPGAARAISGVVPAAFSAQVRQSVYLRVQKAGRDGRLAVRVLMDGREVAAQSTTKPFGLVTILYPPTR